MLENISTCTLIQLILSEASSGRSEVTAELDTPETPTKTQLLYLCTPCPPLCLPKKGNEKATDLSFVDVVHQSLARHRWPLHLPPLHLRPHPHPYPGRHHPPPPAPLHPTDQWKKTKTIDRVRRGKVIFPGCRSSQGKSGLTAVPVNLEKTVAGRLLVARGHLVMVREVALGMSS